MSNIAIKLLITSNVVRKHPNQNWNGLKIIIILHIINTSHPMIAFLWISAQISTLLNISLKTDAIIFGTYLMNSYFVKTIRILFYFYRK